MKLSHEVRFGVFPGHPPWNDMIKRNTYLEKLGLDYLDMGVQFIDHSKPHASQYEGWTTVAAYRFFG